MAAAPAVARSMATPRTVRGANAEARRGGSTGGCPDSGQQRQSDKHLGELGRGRKRARIADAARSRTRAGRRPWPGQWVSDPARSSGRLSVPASLPLPSTARPSTANQITLTAPMLAVAPQPLAA
jgi:hypothetical protein